MSKIQEKLDSLQPYINGIRYIQGLQIVDAIFKEGWTVPTSEIIKKELIEKEKNYYMFFSDVEGVTFDDILDYVENIIKINIEREKKHELLKLKVKELQAIFKETSLNKLQRLTFTFGEDDITPSLMEMDLDEELDAEARLIDDTVPQLQINNKKTNIVETKSTVVTSNGQNIELPPKKVEIDDIDDTPIDTKNRKCECAEHEACSICLG